MSQIYVFTGENQFLLREHTQRWIQGFIEKHGEENLSRLDGGDITFRQLFDEVAAAPFIAEKRLVVVRGMLRGTKEDVQRLQSVIHPDVLVVFVDPSPDKRTAVVKTLFAMADVKNFAPLRDQELQRWMTDLVSKNGTSLHANAAAQLLDRVGSDQQLLAMELEKLLLYCGEKPITSDDVDALVVYQGERQVWALMEMLRKGKGKESISYVQKILERGENAHGLWNMLLWMLSSLIQIAGAKGGNPLQIAKDTGVNIRTVKSLLPLAQQLSGEEVKALVRRLVEYDMSLKTGEFRATDTEQQELTAAIDRVVLSCCL